MTLHYVRTGAEIRTFESGKLVKTETLPSINRAKLQSRILQGALIPNADGTYGHFPNRLGGPNCRVRVGK